MSGLAPIPILRIGSEDSFGYIAAFSLFDLMTMCIWSLIQLAFTYAWLCVCMWPCLRGLVVVITSQSIWLNIRCLEPDQKKTFCLLNTAEARREYVFYSVCVQVETNSKTFILPQTLHSYNRAEEKHKTDSVGRNCFWSLDVKHADRCVICRFDAERYIERVYTVCSYVYCVYIQCM